MKLYKGVIFVPLGGWVGDSFAVAFRVLSRENMTGNNVLFKNWFLSGVKKVSRRVHKTGSWYLLGVLFKISDEHPRPFYMGALHGLVTLFKV